MKQIKRIASRPRLVTRDILVVSSRRGDRVSVRAKVIGLLAVHQSFDDPSLWAVTHEPTGLAIFTKVPTQREALSRARTICRRWPKDLAVMQARLDDTKAIGTRWTKKPPHFEAMRAYIKPLNVSDAGC